MDHASLKNSCYEIRFMDDSQLPKNHSIQLKRCWKDNLCNFKLVNHGICNERIKEIVLFSGEHHLPPDTPFYGEGYTMLSQYKGTIYQLELIGKYSDQYHYKIPQKKGMVTVYNAIQLSLKSNVKQLLAFTSCKRFNGEFRFSNQRYEIVLDTENLCLDAGQEWELEEFTILEGEKREDLFDMLAERIRVNHPQLRSPDIPRGWCSWYGYGPEITKEEIFRNMEVINEKIQSLKYIQIDDGYQAFMGDWLTPHPSFDGDIQDLCLKIREDGFEPAIWVAPFIAEKDSQLFQRHPDWFVKDEKGSPLNSATHSFGGWRNGPWYMLDGTHPKAREYLTYVFKTMHDKWGCHYFKLDANVWGALHGGVHFDPMASRVEAYRRGMEAIIQAVGEDSFILGCNAPMWPSLGLVHGMRVTDDIDRNWAHFVLLAEQGFYRAWQHNKLWINDPDCIVLDNLAKKTFGPDGKEQIKQSILTENEFLFHATYIFASGGMVLSGDRLTTMSDFGMNTLKGCIPPSNMAAKFEDETWSMGKIESGNRTYYCLFNREIAEQEFIISFSPGNYKVTDYWKNESIPLNSETHLVITVSAHTARIVCVKKMENTR